MSFLSKNVTSPEESEEPPNIRRHVDPASVMRKNGLSSNDGREYRILTQIPRLKKKLVRDLSDFTIFSKELINYCVRVLHLSFIRFEASKSIFVTVLYRQRGKYAKRLMHSGMASLVALGVMIAPIVAEEFPGKSVDPWTIPSSTTYVSAAVGGEGITTLISNKDRDKIIEYEVTEGDTISGVANKFNVSADTILWQNNLNERSKIKPGDTLQILPVTGVSHKVQKGDTVYSIAKKYDSSAQAIVDFPYNTFSNDETFELAVGQIIIVPDGVRPSERPSAPRIRQLTPNAGTVVASGTFVWPASGTISQGFVWYHKGIDIANRAAPDVLAADSGAVVVSGWPDNYGYGNRVVIDHGNGYRTLYAHLSRLYVVSGQTVSRGAAIGKMGSTGRSTGIHLHFEVIKDGVYLSPLSVLR